MALYDSAALLERLRFFLMRPESDESYTPEQCYMLLSDAQVQVVNEIATHFPRVLMEAPTLMVTADNGVTYTVDATDADGAAVWPFGHAEVYASTGANGSGQELYGSTYGGREQDVVFEGGRIRMPNNRPRTFATGPYIRYVKPCPVIDADTAPVLQPKDARILIVYRALVLAQSRGGLRSVEWAEELYQRAWRGNPKTGEVGFLGRYATQYASQNTPSTQGAQWWRAWVSGLAHPALTGWR